MNQQTAKKIVEALITDLTDRKGLADVWDGIDQGIQEEIMTKWVGLVMEVDGESVSEDGLCNVCMVPEHDSCANNPCCSCCCDSMEPR